MTNDSKKSTKSVHNVLRYLAHKRTEPKDNLLIII